MERNLDISIVPHLYDLHPDDTGMLFLKSIKGDLAVLSWLYPRPAHWILDRNGIRGRLGQTMMEDAAEHGMDSPAEDMPGHEPGGNGTAGVSQRQIYCLDLRASMDPQEFVREIKRIACELSAEVVPLQSWIKGTPQPQQMQRYLDPTGGNGSGSSAPLAQRRWYPVIDYARCTNCLECIDFCLFGVYGIDRTDTILVQNQDNCKKGCPACSRVCPENAIIFPEHKTPSIAGAPGDGPGGLKVDLSKLFGAPDALTLAALERDVELVGDGREAVGMTRGKPKRQAGKPRRQNDDLDDLIDELDELAI